MNPASVLQMHPAMKVCLDAGAAARLTRADYYRWILDNKPAWENFNRRRQPAKTVFEFKQFPQDI
jgi:hypothetical protein